MLSASLNKPFRPFLLNPMYLLMCECNPDQLISHFSYNRKYNVLSASLNKPFRPFLLNPTYLPMCVCSPDQLISYFSYNRKYNVLSASLNKPFRPSPDRNRAVRSTKASYSKSSHQPDLVSNSLQTTATEITRLESLCESRTKELNYVKMQLKSNTQAFDAMSCLVRYLTEEVSVTWNGLHH